MKHYKELGGYQHTQAQKNILDLTWEKRDQIIFQLLELRESYPKILFNEEIVLEMMLSKNAKETTDHCNMPQRTLTLDLNLNRELLCVLGANVDCSKCGCPFPYEQEARKRGLKNKDMGFADPFKRVNKLIPLFVFKPPL